MLICDWIDCFFFRLCHCLCEPFLFLSNMSILVSSILSTHVYSTTRRNGNVSTVIEQTPLNMENDQVPLGVVNSMKQRLLDKFSESVLNSSYTSGTRSTNGSTLKRTTRLSRSQDSLLNEHSQILPTFLQPKKNVIIVDRTVTKEKQILKRPLSQMDLQVDETPRPGERDEFLSYSNLFCQTRYGVDGEEYVRTTDSFKSIGS